MIKGLVKPLNLFMAGYSYLKSSASKLPVVYGIPPALGVELTNHCNLACPECASGSGQMKRPRGFMDLELYKKLISETGPYLSRISLYFQGEPLLHPGFSSFIKHSGNIHTTISTNGHFLSPENCMKITASGLKKLIISLDGTDQASYSAYRVNGSIETVREGINNILEARKISGSSLEIEIQFLVNRLNEGQVPVIRKYSSDLKIPLKLKSMQIITDGNFESWLPYASVFRRYSKAGNTYKIKQELPNSCARLWLNPVVTWDGKVIPCCFDKDADHIMGDLTQESFREIWNGTRYRMFRRLILSDRSSVKICTNCTSGLKGVKY